MQNTIAIPAIEIRDLAFSWPSSDKLTLEIDYLKLEQGEQLFVAGPSGSGKSTLLALIGGIVTPNSGTISLLGTPLHTLSNTHRDRFRVDHIGFIFQQFNLIPYLSIIENVLLPCRFSAQRYERASRQGKNMYAAAESLLERLDLAADLWAHPVTRLSVGQQQRVAAARALIGRPPVIVADEPTSALDAARQQAFLMLLQHECAEAGSSLIFVSHDERLGENFSMHLNLLSRPLSS